MQTSRSFAFGLSETQIGILLIICSALLSSFGQLFYKLFYLHGVPYLIGGLIFYFVGGVLMMTSYRYGKLSTLQPLLSLSNVFAIGMAIFILGEVVTPERVIGVALIIGGTILIGSDHE